MSWRSWAARCLVCTKKMWNLEVKAEKDGTTALKVLDEQKAALDNLQRKAELKDAHDGILVGCFAQKAWIILSTSMAKMISTWRKARASDMSVAVSAWDVCKTSTCCKSDVQTFRLALSGSIEAARQAQRLAPLLPWVFILAKSMRSESFQPPAAT